MLGEGYTVQYIHLGTQRLWAVHMLGEGDRIYSTYIFE